LRPAAKVHQVQKKTSHPYRKHRESKPIPSQNQVCFAAIFHHVLLAAMHDIFLSYSSADRERVKPLYDALKLQGWTVFWDHATIQTGEQWSHIIEANLNASDCVIVVWTANSVKSEYVLDEATRARNRNILIPVSLDQTPPPIGFGMRQTTDLSDWDNKTDHPKFAAISRPLLDKMRQATQKRLAEFKQQQTELAQTQSQLNQQRDALAQQSQNAQQTQAELTQQAVELEKQRAELARQIAQGAEDCAPKLAAAAQRAKALDAQLTAAREQARLAEQHAAEAATRLTAEIAANQVTQQTLAEQQRQTETLQSNLSAQLSTLQDQHRLALQQAEQAQRAAEEQQRTADQARQVADKNRQTAEDKLRTAEKNQQAEQARLNQQLADQQRELTTLRAQPPVEVETVVEKIVEKEVVKEVRNPKDKLIGVVVGGVLVAAVWGVAGNKSASPQTPVTTSTVAATPTPLAASPQAQTNAPSIEMVNIDAGSFTMGCQSGRDSSCESDESPAHTVSLSSFELGKTEVTQGQWKAVMGKNPSNFSSCGDTCPVEQVSWDDVQTFIQKLNAQTGKNYRLPSEAEWEYACRAGQSSNYCGGDNVDSVAWHGGNSDSKTHPVGGKQANAWGLYDMSGNVYEWVQDWYHSSYKGAPSDGSAWEDSGTYRVLRGGSWNNIPQYSRAAFRNYGTPAERSDFIGFRLARTLP
jgi:formylglycine-generating enzyme required for sulfatase activity